METKKMDIEPCDKGALEKALKALGIIEEEENLSLPEGTFLDSIGKFLKSKGYSYKRITEFEEIKNPQNTIVFVEYKSYYIAGVITGTIANGMHIMPLGKNFTNTDDICLVLELYKK
jgi:hypothetical protein